MTVLVHGKINSMTAHLDMPQHHHYLRHHFFEEIKSRSPDEQNGKTRNHYYVRDRAEFETCGAGFEVRQRAGSGDTFVELTSETAFPAAFDLRIQEALRYLTAKPAFWRARLQSHDKELHLELSSPWQKSARTQFSPPISPGSPHFLDMVGAYWSVSDVCHSEYEGHALESGRLHLYNACETTANSVDAWAVGISVAVEAITGLIATATDGDKAEELTHYQKRVLAWLAEQKDLSADIVKRAQGQINAMSNKRPQDTLYVL